MEYSKVTPEDLKALASIVGAPNISSEDYDLVTNAIDAFAGEPALPEAVIWPESSLKVLEILKYASKRRIPVYVRGGGTGLTGASVPVHGGIVMNMMKMGRIIEVRPLDMQVDVEAGVIYDQLNKELEPHGLFFPPDPASGKSCTIGGMIANNASGLKAVKYGATRDYVLALRAVFPIGLDLRLGSKVFKYSIGYDLARMLVGSEGTLGVITEATLKLRPLPKNRKTIAAYFDSIEAAIKCIGRIRLSGIEPGAIEFLDRTHLRLVAEWSGLSLPDRECMIILELHSYSKVGLEEEASDAINLLKEGGAVELVAPENEAEAERIWEARRGTYPSMLKACRSPIVGDIIVPLSKLLDAVKKAYQLAEKYQVRVGVMGHLGDGNIHTNWLTDRRNRDEWERALKANAELTRYAIEIGGALSAEHGVGLEKKEFMPEQHKEVLELMRRLKEFFDPNDILNPGIML
ncbi:MAG: FAD-linked oxidase C-terminal domain-containing protein [Nitrososphaerota archaeon]|nr:FAD-binding protein [Candidatus Calditenuaceae archaeon]MDW8073521.1 FAD-linked oxidase C-terminal domain-containing protein [Nitrososphaerota archaeon]